ncbi:MAG: SpoIID/LytB domain-containing protein [Clostridia bacterium]|nr:SpoIID/LytB domain-containing protein [Clostridia bacterium]
MIPIRKRKILYPAAAALLAAAMLCGLCLFPAVTRTEAPLPEDDAGAASADGLTAGVTEGSPEGETPASGHALPADLPAPATDLSAPGTGTPAPEPSNEKASAPPEEELPAIAHEPPPFPASAEVLDGGEPTVYAPSTPSAPSRETPDPTPESTPDVSPSPSPVYPPAGGISDRDITLTVYDIETQSVISMRFDDYVRRALAAEMSGDAPLEALKAQAAAIRSYVLSKASVSYKVHHGAMTCNDSNHCMSCVTEERYASTEKVHRDRYEQALRESDGLAVFYDGKIVTTNFHSCSYFYTAGALEVFGVDLPYLQSVPTAVYRETVQTRSYTTKELIENFFGPTHGQIYLSSGEPRFGGVEETDSGRVDYVTICGQRIAGGRFREIFGFRSTRFETGYDPETDVFTFTVYGSGHGVGMSQSGAKVMAAEGKNCHEILCHYYTGVTVRHLTAEDLTAVGGILEA